MKYTSRKKGLTTVTMVIVLLQSGIYFDFMFFFLYFKIFFLMSKWKIYFLKS